MTTAADKVTTPNEDYFAADRAEIVPFLPDAPKRVLEIGCGRGGFRHHVAAAEYWGIEPNKAAADAAKLTLTKVLDGFFDENAEQLPDNYFDLVICNDVIEHMPSHEQFLLDIKPKMAPGSFLVGSVPNIRYVGQLEELLFERDWRYQDAGIMDRTHLRFFTLRSFERALSEAGFDVHKLEGINPFHNRSGLKGMFSLLSRKRFWLQQIFGSDSKFRQLAFAATLK